MNPFTKYSSIHTLKNTLPRPYSSACLAAQSERTSIANSVVYDILIVTRFGSWYALEVESTLQFYRTRFISGKNHMVVGMKSQAQIKDSP
jgi:hypothetical protein